MKAEIAMKSLIQRIIGGFAVALVMCSLRVAAIPVDPVLVSEWNLGNSSVALEDASVAAQIVAYNVAHDPDLPLLAGLTKIASQSTAVSSYVQAGSDNKILSWTAPTECDFYYIMTKWGKGQASWEHALWFVPAGDTVTYNPGGSGAPNGLSHVSIWCGDTQHVPDGGATIALLGMGVLGLGALRRKIS